LVARELFPEFYGTRDPFDSLYGEAMETKKQGNTDKEIQILETAIASRSIMPYCYERLAILYSKVKNYKRAYEVCMKWFDSGFWKVPNSATTSLHLLDRLEKLRGNNFPNINGTSSSIKVTASIERGTGDTVQRLLKEATQKKRDGNLYGAIEVLKAAYKELDKHTSFFPIAVYLRLPLYLQEAGKSDEAWGEFNRLVLWVSSKPRYSPEVTPMELSSIWDKMRLVLQREGKNDYAVQFAVWSYLAWAVGLYMQNKEDELKVYKEEINIKQALKTSLHKAHKEFLTDRLVRIISNSLNDLPTVDYNELARTIEEEMRLSSK
jgi:tetratricopeptide (TPR) repeat protein